MQFLRLALPFRLPVLGSAAALLVFSAATSAAQNPPPAPKPTTQKPGPTLTPVKAGPNEVIHVVKRGDTLWDLAKAYLKDPFKWPEVFQRNIDIVENPHWIYPGETIRIPASEVKPEVLAKIATKPAPPSDRTVFSTLPAGMGPDRISASGEVLGRFDVSGVPRGEIEAAPFAARFGGPVNKGRLAAAYDRPGIQSAAGERRFQLEDRIFVELPRGVGGNPGDLLLAYHLGPEISDVGQIVIPTGIVRVEANQPGQPALGRVVRQFGEITLDQAVIPLESIPAAVGKAKPVPPGPAEKVLYVVGDPVLPSLQNYVILSAKSANGVRVGDQFTLIDDSVDPKYPSPPVAGAIGEVARVTPYGVTLIIVDHEQPRIYAGMLARLSARAP
ncbi:MAG TPA: LysM peptidoglycan-binding domain-containing protein [Gemmatimonadaceae bacterium]|nr:LysM peptidoglycan-binding domain-containing protein [Gemmatimonadaceae bacterium]